MNRLDTLRKKELKHLTNKKEHTKHKIEYVSEYVKQWLFVACNGDCENINFIDSMSNAGIYQDGDLCTAVEVLKIFCERAANFPNKTFNVLFNDFDNDKIRIAKEVSSIIISALPKNVRVFYDTEDVNDYLNNVKGRYNIFSYSSLTIMYVDPFDFRTVHIPTLRNFIKDTYCEVIFNMFTSDFVRNGVDPGIAKSLGGDYKFSDKDELWEHISNTLLVGKMKYCLSYPFKNIKNTELYQILFITPSDKGLDKLKQAIWNTFDGRQYYRTDLSYQGQLSLFTPADDREIIAKQYGEEAFKLIENKFKGQVVHYNILAKYILSRSLLMSSQLLTYVFKPCLSDKRLVKQNEVGKNNFKEDSYLIK